MAVVTRGLASSREADARDPFLLEMLMQDSGT